MKHGDDSYGGVKRTFMMSNLSLRVECYNIFRNGRRKLRDRG